MTNEEYINFANCLKNNYTIDFDVLPEFCDMAISLSENKGELTYCPPCIDCNKKMDEIRRTYDKLKDLPSVENKGEWIPISERLPEVSQNVLATTKWGEVTIAERLNFGPDCRFIHEGNTNAHTEDIVAWQPLPEPYKGGEV